jgi:hypothetical protein
MEGAKVRDLMDALDELGLDGDVNSGSALANVFVTKQEIVMLRRRMGSGTGQSILWSQYQSLHLHFHLTVLTLSSLGRQVRRPASAGSVTRWSSPTAFPRFKGIGSCLSPLFNAHTWTADMNDAEYLSQKYRLNSAR